MEIVLVHECPVSSSQLVKYVFTNTEREEAVGAEKHITGTKCLHIVFKTSLMRQRHTTTGLYSW